MKSKKTNQILDKIKRLKKERRAVILAHNYQTSDVQDIADFTGDSLELSRKAAETEAKVIVFCGVNFMAETASILSPDKKVIIPDNQAGCTLADMITADKLKTLKSRHPEAVVISYVNTTAEVKAESDICCTSSNSIQVVNSIPRNKEIIFVPDKNLCRFTQEETNRKLICWQGWCSTPHTNISAEDIKKSKQAHPDAKVMVHPECNPEVIDLADEVVSTSGMLRFAKRSKATEFIVGTEIGMLYSLKKANPKKEFYPANDKAICPTMKLITLEKVYQALKDLVYIVKVEESIRQRAKRAIDRMLEVS